MNNYSNLDTTFIRSTQSFSAIQREETLTPTQVEGVANASFTAREEDLLVDVVKTTKKMNNYAKGSVSRIERAESLFDKLIQDNQTPNTVTYNTLIKGYVNSGQLEMALETSGVMRNNDIKPDLFTYNTLILGCGLQSFVDKAFEIFDFIIQDNLDPDAYTYTNLINACIRVEDVDRMQEAIHLLHSSRTSPTLVTYNTIIKGLFSLNNPEAVQAVLVAMEEKGIEPDAWTYGTILQGYLALEKYADVLEMYHSIKNPEVFHAKIVMDSYAKQGLYRKVIAFFIEEETKITSNNILYAHVIRAHIKLGEIHEACMVLDIVEETASGPDSHCIYPILMACTEARASLAFNLFLRMRELGLAVDAKATNRVIQVCTKAKMDRKAAVATAYLLWLNKTQAAK